MLNRRRGWGQSAMGPYVKLIWCSGVASIYGQFEEKGWVQSAVGICAFFYM